MTTDLERDLRADPARLVEVLTAVWAAAQGHRCRHCGQGIRLSLGAGEPYWYHVEREHAGAFQTVWCSGWGDPSRSGVQAEPEEP